jgi:hypothetical protein
VLNLGRQAKFKDAAYFIVRSIASAFLACLQGWWSLQSTNLNSKSSTHYDCPLQLSVRFFNTFYDFNNLRNGPVLYVLDQFRGAACVSIEFLADGIPGLPEHAVSKQCIELNLQCTNISSHR